MSKELAEAPSLDRPKDQEISLANADTEAREELFDLAGELTEWLPLRDRSRVDLAAEGWLPGFAASPWDGQFFTIHAGHADIRKQDGYVVVSTKDLQRIDTIGDNQGIVTEPLDKIVWIRSLTTARTVSSSSTMRIRGW